MNKQKELQRTRVLLSRWISEITLDNGMDFFDINRISEGFSAKLLNLVFEYELQDLNKVQKNHPGIDLGDFKNKIAFQVTSRTDFKKLVNDLSTFVKIREDGKSLSDKFHGGIRFLILNNKPIASGKTDLATIYPPFDKNKHIISSSNLYSEIANIYEIDIVRFGKIKELLESEFRDNEILITTKSEELWSDLLFAKSFLEKDLIDILNKYQSTSINFNEPEWEILKQYMGSLQSFRIHVPDEVFQQCKYFYEDIITNFFNNTFKNSINNLTHDLENSDFNEVEKNSQRVEMLKLILIDFWKQIDNQIDIIGKLIHKISFK